jgi:hypothetical protein
MNKKNCYLSVTVLLMVLLTAFGCNKDKDEDTVTYTVGQSYGGGIVFYVDGTGEHGLGAATSDQSTSCQWGCAGTLISAAEDTAIGVGQANTTAIVSTCTASGIAAKICNTLSLNGYDDWFLPSKLELDLLYQQRAVIGGFTIYGYWSSSQHGSGTAWVQYFNDGTKATTNKSDGYRVRAIRAI